MAAANAAGATTRTKRSLRPPPALSSMTRLARARPCKCTSQKNAMAVEQKTTPLAEKNFGSHADGRRHFVSPLVCSNGEFSARAASIEPPTQRGSPQSTPARSRIHKPNRPNKAQTSRKRRKRAHAATAAAAATTAARLQKLPRHARRCRRRSAEGDENRDKSGARRARESCDEWLIQRKSTAPAQRQNASQASEQANERAARALIETRNKRRAENDF